MNFFLFPHFMALHADNCGYALLSPPWVHPRRKLGSSVLIVGHRGRVPLVSGSEHHTIGPGTVTLLPAEQIHYGTEAIATPVSYFWVHFTTDNSPVLLAQAEAETIFSEPGIVSHKLDGAALLPLHFSLGDPEPIYQAFHGLLYEQENPTYSTWKFQILFQSLVISLTERVIGSQSQRLDGGGRTSAAYDIVKFLAEHLTDPNLSIKMVSSAIGLNSDYAGRRFKETMGLSVGDYILKKRVELAVRILQETSETINAVATHCGFSSVRNFLRQFKTEQGLTPTEVRKRHRVMHVNSL